MHSFAHAATLRGDARGFTQFLPLSDLHDASKGYLENDTLRVEVEVQIKKDTWLSSMCVPLHVIRTVRASSNAARPAPS